MDLNPSPPLNTDSSPRFQRPWARGYSEGFEVKAKYQTGNVRLYANFAFSITRATDPVSNQYLLDSDEYAFLLTHYHYTDDMQMMTGSAGASYRWNKTLFTVGMIRQWPAHRVCQFCI